MTIDLDRNVDLVPVVEFEPVRYQKPGRTHPDASGLKAMDRWHAYWRDSLADAGLTGLEPVPHTWLVPVDQLIKPDDLTVLLRSSVIAPALEVDPLSLKPEHFDLDEFIALSGGYALRSSHGWHVRPRCCGDLSNLGGWRDTASGRIGEWQQLWIGHPCISYRFIDGRVQLTGFSEDAEPLPIFRVDPGLLQSAVRGAEYQVHLFHERLLPVLRTLVDPAVVGPLADVLVGGGESRPGGRS